MTGPKPEFAIPMQVPMKSTIADFADDQRGRSPHPDPARGSLGFIAFLVLSSWCGLAAGLLEVGTIVTRKQVIDRDQLYRLSHHFVWLIPVLNSNIFLTLGVLGWLVSLAWRRRGYWLSTRALCAPPRCRWRSSLPFRGFILWPGWLWHSGCRCGSFHLLSGMSRPSGGLFA